MVLAATVILDHAVTMFKQKVAMRDAPSGGLEPPTTRLRVRRSTD